jgi:molybdate transport system substrate-binding protein
MTSQGLHLLSAGAAQGLVAALEPRFVAATGIALRATFGAVGAIREKLIAGEPCDALILTATMLDELAASGRVVPESRTALGRVRTGIGVRSGDALPDISTPAVFEQSLRAATEIFLPDPERATAGIHFVRVLNQLGLYDEVSSRLRPHPNGAAAMHALAQCASAKPIGCTQISEIKYADGVTLAGPLPQAFELATIYSIGVCTNARSPELAQRFVALICGLEAASVRIDAGFEAMQEP